MHAKRIALALAASFLVGPVLAETITVVTSFPKELTEAYKKAYEKKYPADKVEILNKGTSAGIAYVRHRLPNARRNDRAGSRRCRQRGDRVHQGRRLAAHSQTRP
jgi:hypothetical protein